MEEKAALYRVGSVAAYREALRALEEQCSCDPPATHGAGQLYDTFDGRLRRRGYRLRAAANADGVELVCETLTGAAERSLHVPRIPEFASDLPAGPFRDWLDGITDVRRLLVVGDVRTHAGLVVRNARGKAVAHVVGEQWRGERGRLLRVLPVRGYGRAFRRVTGMLDALGLARAKDRRPRVRSKGFGLDAAMRTDQAAKLIYTAQLEAIRHNEEGVRHSLDSEFLHDFRVAVRRTRAGLAQIKDVFAPSILTRAQREFRWLGDITGPVRDLDVYLLKVPAYEALVEANLKPLRKYLAQRHAEEHAELVAALATRRYRNLLRWWSGYLARPVPQRPRAANARRPVRDVAAERIWRLHQRVLKAGGAIHAETPDRAVHDLRLLCKKLRYLMEFAREVFPDAVDDQIRELKRLQDNLGDFNDFAVQRAGLKAIVHDMSERGLGGIETHVRMGQLLAVLRDQQRRERRRFHARFRRYAHRANRRRAKKLFGKAAS